MKWTVNCRGVENGANMVAVKGSEEMDAVDRSRLIAAAPELFEALKHCMPWLTKVAADHDGDGTGLTERASKQYNIARAAIAAAEKGG